MKTITFYYRLIHYLFAVNQKTKTMGVNKSSAVLVFSNEKGVIALYNKDNNMFDSVTSLFNPSGAAKNCPATIWIDNFTGQVNIAKISQPPPPLVIPYTKHSEAWLAGDNIVIGVGDMRGGFREIYRFNLTRLQQDDFVIKYYNNNTIEVYCAFPAIPETLHFSVYQCI